MHIVDLIFEENRNRKDRKAIVDAQGTLSYGSFEEDVNRLKVILADHGVGENYAVGVMGRNSRQFIISVFACLKLNAIVFPLSAQLKSDEVNAILKKSKISFLLDDGEGAEVAFRIVDNPTISNKTWTFSKAQDSEISPLKIAVDDPAIIRYSSGTTGKAKGVVINHQSIFERIESANKGLTLTEEDVIVWVLPMSYHFVVSIFLYLKNGCTIALAKDFQADSIADCIIDNQGTFLYVSPMHIKMLSAYQKVQEFPSLKKVISTSTAISKQQCDLFYAKFKIPVSQAYGIIEIGLPIINDSRSDTQPEAVGHALPDYTIGILDKTFNVLPDGAIGHLGIKGPGMFNAYLEPFISREQVLQNEWFLTGDLASKDKSGLIKIEGREKTMINVSGNKVFPIEVEQVLCKHESVDQAKVSGTHHRLMGEIVKAEIVLKKGASADSESIIRFCRQRLSTYKLPQKIKFVDRLEMTDSGKILRR